MRILVVAQHDGRAVRAASRCALSFAVRCAEATGGGPVGWLALGHRLDRVTADAAGYAPVFVADSPALADPAPDRYARVIADVVADNQVDMLVAASSTFSKDVVSRAAGLLGGAMAGDVIGHEFRDGELLLRRPMYAGAVTATVALCGRPKIVTVRSSAYSPQPPCGAAADVTPVAVDEASLPNHIEYDGLESNPTGRPDVTEARVVVSAGRAVRNHDDFERLVGGLADVLGAATGSTRALVDAGITPNEFQVGQTGKIVAPELYIALGISGAVQHLAGMKNAKLVVAINNDPEAPIFDAADYGLVNDVYEVVPQLIDKFKASNE